MISFSFIALVREVASLWHLKLSSEGGGAGLGASWREEGA